LIERALVLTAGLGTRLRPLTDVRAKAAIPVAGEPMIRRIIRWLVARGTTDLVLNLHHRPETITASVGDGSDLGARVRYSWEQPRVLGTAGGPRAALPLLASAAGEPFLIVNGDTLTDIDLHEIYSAHRAAHALVTLALVPNREFMRYGGILLDAGRRVVGFVPRGPGAQGSFHYVGVQVAHAEAFRELRAGAPANSIGGVYDAIVAAQPGAIRGFICDAEFRDVGTAADYWRTSFALAAREGRCGSTAGRDAVIHPTARVTRSILWDDVEIGGGATIEDCIVTDRVIVPAGADYRRAILVRDTITGDVTASAFDPEADLKHAQSADD
jgi:NDP-sugar pyrophosphorylase family protein